MAAINHVMLSDAVSNNRFSAEFFDPKYVFEPDAKTSWVPIGRILKECEYGISISMNSQEKGFPIFRMNELENCFALRPEKYAEISDKEFEQYRLKPNDVLFNRTNSFDFVGRTGLVKDQTDCTFASYLIRLIPDTDSILPEYLTIYLNTRFGIGQVKRRAMRSINQANVSGSEIRRVLIPVFDKPVQQIVADLVNASFKVSRASITAYIQAQQLLESELGLDRRRIQKSVGYTTSYSNLDQSRRVDAEFFKPEFQEILKQLLKRKHKFLGRIFNISRGICIDPRVYNEIGIPFIRIKELSLDRPLFPEHSIKIHHKDLQPNFPLAVQGDYIIAAIGATIGKVNLIDESMAGSLYSNNTACLSPKINATHPYALELLLRSYAVQMQIQQRMAKTAQEKISDWELRRILIPEIDLGILNEIERKCKIAKSDLLESEKMLEQAKTLVEQLIEKAVKS